MRRAPLYLPNNQQRRLQQPGPDCMYLASGQIVCSSQKDTSRRAADLVAAGREGFAPSDDSLPDPLGSVHPVSVAALQFLASTVQLSGIHSISAPANLSPGLTWNRYDQGYFNDDFGAFKGLTPSDTGITNGWTDVNQAPGDGDPNLLPISKTTEFSFTITGYFVPQTTGTHNFVVASDDAGYLWLGSDAVSAPTKANVSINNGGLHGMTPIKASVPMTAGQVYPLLIMFGQNFGGFGLQFAYNTPNGQITTNGNGFFFSDVPAVVGTPPGSRPGLSWSRFDHGYFNDQPSAFVGLDPSAKGITSGWIDLDRTPGARTAGYLPIARTNKFSFVVVGMFVPKKTGNHTFTLSSDDASYLWIGRERPAGASTLTTASAKINLGGLHGNNRIPITVAMLAGQAYHLLILFGQNEGGFNLQFSFTAPGSQACTDGTGFFFTDRPDESAAGPAGSTAGLTWARYDQGYFNDQPSWFKGITASATGTTNGWNDLDRNINTQTAGTLPISRTNRFSFLVWGAFLARTTGVHTLILSSDDAAYMWIGPAALGEPSSLPVSSATINLGGLHGNNSSSVNISLVAGQAYPILFMFGQNEGGFNFQFAFQVPGSNVAFSDGTGHFFTASPGTTWPPTSVAPSGFSGRFIKLEKPVAGCMHFTEVMAFSPGSGVNIALNKQVTTSSVGWNGLPKYLTDGIITQNPFTHSDCKDRPWFLIDLGSVMPISSIEVYNRTDCCQSRENGVVITVLDGNQNVVFTADPLQDRNGARVDNGDGGAAYAAFYINPPSTSVVGGSGNPVFRLQDVATGTLVRYASGSNKVTLDPAAEVVNWCVHNDGSVYNQNQGGVGLRDDKTQKYIRHAGFVTWEYPFVPNNWDFAWVFHTTPVADVYTISNFYGNNNWLNYNGQQLLISSETPRKWQIHGSERARSLVKSVAR